MKINQSGKGLSLNDFYRIERVMKMAALFLFLGVSIAFSNTYSQTTLLTFDISGKTIQEVIGIIEEETEYVFFFSDDIAPEIRKKVDLHVKSETLDKILDNMFIGTDISYRIIDRQVVVSKDTKGLSLSIRQQQTRTISGRVTSQHGELLIGVNIRIKGTTYGTTTDVDGEYQLTNVAENAVLVFSYVGMETKEIPVGRQTTIHVSLMDTMVDMDDIVIVGYGSQTKESLTSAITSVNTELLENRSLPKVSTALQGITPGVTIRQQTGRPGYSASSFDIRGASMGTFSENKPLVLIDGIVDELDNVSPEDIEKISILKDAAAAAIYGSRATGGVVLITTKKGVSGKPVIAYTGSVGMQKLPFGDYKFLGSAEWMRANNEAARLDGSPDIYSAEQIARYENSTDPQYPARSQWTDWISKNALQHNHTLSVRGGGDKLTFYTSGNYVGQDGFIDNDDYKKINLLLNMTYAPTDRFELNMSMAYQRENITRPIDNVFNTLRNALLNPPTDPFYLSNGEYNNRATLGYNPAYINKEGGDRQYEFNRYRMSVGARYKLLDGLHIHYTLAANLSYNVENYLFKKIPFLDEEGVVYGYNRSDVRVEENWARSNYYNNLIMLDYNKQLGYHKLYVMGAFQSEENRTDNISATANKFPTNEIREIAGSSGAGADISGMTRASDWAIASFIGKVSYSFRDRYLLDGTLRYDGSSRFSPNQRWGLFPSLSASWRIREEAFMQSLDFLSNLKLRLSWGQLGNQGKDLYPFTTQITTTEKFAFGNELVSVATMGSPFNMNLSWEKKSTTNVGLDFGFLNQRLTGSFDFFFDRTDGIIGRPTVPTTFGAAAPIQNTYIIDNRGYEIELRWQDRIGDFQYYIGANLFDARDKIVSLGGIGTMDPDFGTGLVQKDRQTYNAEGKARNSLHLYRTNGLFVDQTEVDNHAYISNLTKPGDIVFIDTNNDNRLTADDKVADKRTTTPHYIYGINLGASYKNFDLSAVFNGVGQRWSYRNDGGLYLTGVRPTLSIVEDNYKNRWTETNPNKWADQPRLTHDNWIANEYSSITAGPCEYHLRNFKYLRLKNLLIGYTLPAHIVQKISLSRLRCYVTMENLFTIKPGYKEPIDPESVMNYNEEASAFFGVPRVISFGLSVNF